MAPDATSDNQQAAGDDLRRLYYFNTGFLKQRRVRQIMRGAGYGLRLGRPGAEDAIAVWGRSPYAARGEKAAEATGAGLIRVEDAFLRSLRPGRAGEPPLGLIIDHTGGVHFDATAPSALETMLASHPLDDASLLNRARGGIERMKSAHLSKYFGHDPDARAPDPGYVLVVDQTRGDASVKYGRADANSFREALYWAREDNPGARIVIKTHPETAQGFRDGYFTEDDAGEGVELYDAAISPWDLLEGAIAVYVVSSQLGFEAILTGHKPVVFGQPFYAGWGLTDDRNPHPLPRRGRNLTRAQLFAAAMILTPVWYDPCHGHVGRFEDTLSAAEAAAREWREDSAGWVARGMRLWKRRHLQQFFGRHRGMIFSDTEAATNRHEMIWAGKAPPESTAIRVEDGFLRSRGLGAELVPPLSLVADDLGIYYDPTGESRLERMIAARTQMRPDQEDRAERLIQAIRNAGVSKYNLGGATPDLPKGHRILVPGQVEDDASIRLGAGQVNTNAALLRAAREANPDAVILFKPHPDVETGLRPGALSPDDAALADMILNHADPMALLDQVDEVWTMTSLLGFEALLRGVRVTVTGAPFYAGWGLTRDLGVIPDRRRVRVGLNGLIHAALIDYPRYRDPVSGLACGPELAVERLALGALPRPGLANRLLAKLQGVFASKAHWWRR